MAEDLLPGQRLDLGEAVLRVFWVHRQDLLARRRPQNFDDFDELVDTAFSREDRLPQHKLCDHAAYRPDVNVGSVVGVSEDELRGAVVSRADVGNVGFAADELLGTAEVAELEDVRTSVNEDVLWLDVPVADALRVDVGDRAQQLVRVQLHQQVRHHLLHLQVLLHHSVGRVWDEVHDNVEVDLFGLVTVSVERLAHLDAVGVVEHLEDLKLSVLVALVLEDLLDGHRFARLRNRRFEHHAERTISDDFLRVVCEALLNTRNRTCQPQSITLPDLHLPLAALPCGCPSQWFPECRPAKMEV